MEGRFIEKAFAHRSVKCFFLVIMLMLSTIFRVAVIINKNYKQIQSEQSAYRIDIAQLRGTIYDCNMVPFTNASKQTVAAVLPTPRGITAISSVVDIAENYAVINQLKNKKPAICVVDEQIESDGICCAEIYKHTTDNMSACHIIGYTDSEGHGVSGLELAYDDLLYSDKMASAVFTTSAKGDILNGVKPFFENDLTIVKNGIVSTLDINIQNIAEQASAQLKSGAVVIAEAANGKIRASVSKPDFNVNDIAASLGGEGSPLLNKALCAYSVGSVFKPCVAAAAIEAGFGEEILNCTGEMEIIDRKFKCHKLDGHGSVTLQSALAQSCNCYFYDLGVKIGIDRIYNIASSLNFGTNLRIADKMFTSNGNLEKASNITNSAQIANISIGQGGLLLSPISMLTLYCAIASDGCYYIPSIVEKTYKDGVFNNYDIGHPTRVMREETAATLRQYLVSVLTEGTGEEAKPENCTAAGKTATAQTGQIDESGAEITNSWFCGFFPANEPKYVVVVMSQGATEVSAASIFANIADGVTEYNNYK